MYIVIGGGDARMGYAANKLQSKGCSVAFWGCDESITDLCPSAKVLLAAPQKADLLLLPLPLTRDGETVANASLSLAEVEEVICRFSTLLCGAPTPSLCQKAEQAGVRVVDLLREEAYITPVAHMTADATLGLLLTRTKRRFCDLSVGILGYGRIGRCLAKELLCLGARVTVFARGKEKPVLAKADGVTKVEEMPRGAEALASLSVLINTVPAPTVSEEILKSLPSDLLLIELATGIHFPISAAQPLVLGHGLPGKILPLSAGELLADLCLPYLTENIYPPLY